MRKRLIELIENGADKYRVEPVINGCRESFHHFLSNHLIENGVIVMPKGEWKITYRNKKPFIFCSHCKTMDPKRNLSYHCPHCGAEMAKITNTDLKGGDSNV